MATECSSGTPSAELLRALAEAQGVFPEDADLESVRGFLDVVLPRLAEIERELPPGTTVA
jgi:hypothetical protein